jgi:hypothetical protein
VKNQIDQMQDELMKIPNETPGNQSEEEQEAEDHHDQSKIGADNNPPVEFGVFKNKCQHRTASDLKAEVEEKLG